MSWIQKLYETYEHASVDLATEDAPPPIAHVSQQAHIQIILDGAGNFHGAEIVAKETTLVPATEDSAGRGGKIPPPHPLCDKIQYVAKDYPAYGGEKSFFEAYRSLLSDWNQAYPHEKLRAILSYIDKGQVVADLVKKAKILHVDEDDKLLASWPDSRNKPQIFTLVKNQGEAFVRWIVDTSALESRTWKDGTLMDSWIQFVPRLLQKRGLCLITGDTALLGTKHPKGIRFSGDNAKLISANDTDGYTYRGRFIDSEQACSVGYEASQKAHSALRWLIRRQSFRNDDQVIVAWEVSGKNVPSPVQNSYYAFWNDDEEEAPDNNSPQARSGSDFGQLYARKLSAKIAGYRRELRDSKDIVVIGLDSATTGRMAITYYRELTGSEFLERLETWHRNYAWFQNYSKEIKFTGAPSPKEIAEAAFGRRLDTKISKATVDRLLPCVVDGMPVPQDLVRSTCRRAANRVGMEHWEWEKVLGIACSLFNGVNKGGYGMALDTERTSRDYLYGRLLAVAERLEYIALSVAGENRDTTAARLMQRFAERPCSTWLQIERSLVPYKTRLQTRRIGFLHNMKKLLDEIHALFKTEDYVSDAPLSGEFLLGYHCQRSILQAKSNNEEETSSTGINKEEN